MSRLNPWVEIPAADFDRAVDFYNNVFKLNLVKNDWGKEKMACFPNDEGSISFSPGFKPAQDGTLASFNVPDSIEEALKRAKSNGGNVVLPKTKIEAEGRGYFALLIDSEGNKIGLYGNE
ncbi:MAG: VOC family protein [Bacteroidales bacterium]|nr:VOC family protein [Bacteroidales bacterium]MBN2819545.1 VOC family protein [Bacteroidales bacterium]